MSTFFAVVKSVYPELKEITIPTARLDGTLIRYVHKMLPNGKYVNIIYLYQPKKNL
jgi:hypothetical protein